MYVVVIEFGTSYFCLVETKEYAQLHIERSSKQNQRKKKKNLRRKSKTEREEMPFWEVPLKPAPAPAPFKWTVQQIKWQYIYKKDAVRKWKEKDN